MTDADALGARSSAEVAAHARLDVRCGCRQRRSRARIPAAMHGAQCRWRRRRSRCVMRHFPRTALAIALLTQRMGAPTAQGVLVAAPGCAYARAAHETPTRIGAVALAAITRGADAKQPAAACTVHAPVIVAHVPEPPPTGDWTPPARQPTLRPSIRAPWACGAVESRGTQERPRNQTWVSRPAAARCSTRPRATRRVAAHRCVGRSNSVRDASADPLGLSGACSSPTPMALPRVHHRNPAHPDPASCRARRTPCPSRDTGRRRRCSRGARRRARSGCR